MCKRVGAFQKGEIMMTGTSVGHPQTDLPSWPPRGHGVPSVQAPHLSITDNLTVAQIKVLGRSKQEALKKGLAYLTAWA